MTASALTLISRPMRRVSLFCLVGFGLFTGCVERRFVISTDVPGAVVYDEKGLPIGATPVDKEFTYYGKYRFTLVKDGYQTQVVDAKVRAPWYGILPLDFISENLIPWTIRDVRRLDYILQPAQMIPPEAIRQEAEQLRARGQALQPTP